MSRLSGWLTPETRATLEAVLAKLAAPGMCNPDDDTPVVDGPPSEEAVQRDTRSTAQRNHDGLNAACVRCWRQESWASTTGYRRPSSCPPRLKNSNRQPAKHSPAGAPVLPMSDVIRLARHAHHYLAIFDEGKAMALYHTKRLASPGAANCAIRQRPRLYPRRAATSPGTGAKSITSKTGPPPTPPTSTSSPSPADPDHKLVEHGWTTRKRKNGNTEWIPPPHLDHGQPRTNTYHHPEKLLSRRRRRRRGEPET